ncbi:MAG: hypothetical protein QG656_767 [Candidatus Hydrogenedentes bacterium]|nr:hypothetical protein [Candidatus Hydrogenedentota bacterium]
MLTMRSCRMGLFVGLLLCVPAVVYAADTVRGVVFDDEDGNCYRDRGERGLRGVCVSNGRDVARTSWGGRYELPIAEGDVVFVVKPTGWMTPVDANRVPRFFYVHKPAGAPALEYAGVPPTGELPASVDFPLMRQRESKRFKAILFGDTQARNQQEANYLVHDICEELVGTDAAFGVTLGDIVFNDLSVFEPLTRSLGVVGVPWYGVIGNHDHNQDVPDDVHAEETFTRVYGPPYYAFNYGKVHFIALGSVQWDGEDYHGELGSDQLAFVANDLKWVPKDRLIVLMMHIPVMDFKDRAELLALLSNRPHTFSCSAHWHTQKQFFLTELDGWTGKEPHHHLVQGTACGGWWSGVTDELGIPHATMADGTPNGYSIVSFDGNDYTIEYKAARRPADFQMTIDAPETVKAVEATATEVAANVFAGTERSRVEMRLGEDGPWIPMTKTERQDPYFLRLKRLELSLPDVAGRKLPEPDSVSHLWVAPLPANPKLGMHLIHVRTEDMYGHVYEAERAILVE